MRARDGIGEGERWGIRHAPCLQAKDGHIIKLEYRSAEDSGYQDRHDCDRGAAHQPKQTTRR